MPNNEDRATHRKDYVDQLESTYNAKDLGVKIAAVRTETEIQKRKGA